MRSSHIASCLAALAAAVVLNGCGRTQDQKAQAAAGAPPAPVVVQKVVYFQIGLVTLLGLAAKNAVLIVEYASLMGGMLAATFLAIFFVPMFFKVISARRLKESRSTQQIQAEVEHAQHLGERGPPHPSRHVVSSGESEQGEPA